MYYAIADEARADLALRLIDAGYVGHLVNACDTIAWSVGILSRRVQNTSTFAHLLRVWVPLLKSRGVTDAQLETICVHTPRHLLAF
jgi:predicted metal-dependent phosphotriesterase family hydrolase